MKQAQDELRAAYLGGVPGVAVSGLVWLVAGLVWDARGPGTAFIALFFGGIAIFPLSLAVARAFGAKPASKTNPLNALGFETTVPLFAGLFVAYALIGRDPPLAFALFAAIVGARYFAFATLYRDRTYWVLGGVMMAVGYVAAIKAALLPLNVAICIGAVEFVFAAILAARHRARA
ncbi:DUF7010 family protein [Glacieibacterium frigidum]|uniref:Uncharacterized protein n=1 Tax=Glacieibacterium frigidum TaxID=2593303 RepID=A0A552UIS5_9SPHN|nr:hypothetical protein [Glacieibacterium frigidum]TRW18107.1 hypothetical protein FMM06_08370 [Glacieibacterium frigidum]